MKYTLKEWIHRYGERKRIMFCTVAVSMLCDCYTVAVSMLVNVNPSDLVMLIIATVVIACIALLLVALLLILVLTIVGVSLLLIV